MELTKFLDKFHCKEILFFLDRNFTIEFLSELYWPSIIQMIDLKN